MAQTAAHLADRGIPPVPVRQWVVSAPKRLRGFLADGPGAVSFLHRFGSALNRHVHLHACVADGVFAGTPSGPVLKAAPFTSAAPFRGTSAASGSDPAAGARRPRPTLRASSASGRSSLIESARLNGLDPRAYLLFGVWAHLRGERMPLPHDLREASLGAGIGPRIVLPASTAAALPSP